MLYRKGLWYSVFSNEVSYTNKEYNMNIQEQKAIGKELLEKLYILSPSVVIAGGAARDWYLGQEARDLDIYLSYRANQPIHGNGAIIANWLGIDEKDFKTLGVQFDENKDQSETYAINPNVRCVYEFEYKGMTVQIINMHTEYVNVSDFCLSICQAWTKDCERIYTTKDFNYSVKNRVIYKTGEIYLEKARYIDKMKSRFPEYSFFESKPL